MSASRRKATGIGVAAVLMWSTLALLTTLTGNVPPLLLTALTFSVATILGTVVSIRLGVHPRSLLSLGPAVWLTSVGGFFGYHFFYFMALRQAPVVAANLVNYLWPLLMVLLASFLPGERLTWRHVLGAMLGFGGAALVITGGRALQIDPQHVPGYLAALACALTWAIYSVLTRRFGTVPTSAVGAFCGATAALSWAAHFLLEETVWPVGVEWWAVLVMGVGPVGFAFYAWDHGVKRGSITTLGSLSYFDPLLSTLLLILAGRAPLTWWVAGACLLIVGGAVLAAGVGRRDSPEVAVAPR